ncbi:hypothetical protein D3C81_1098560 [compost metagenome]
MLGLLEQLRLLLQRQAQAGAGIAIVAAPGDLQQAAPAIPPAIARLSVAVPAGIGIVGDRLGLACQGQGLGVRLAVGAAIPPLPCSGQPLGAVVEVLHQSAQVAGLVPDLGQKRRLANPAIDLPARHRPIQCRHKNARDWAGIGEDLQQLLLCDWHSFLQA